MQINHYANLLERYSNNTLTPDEFIELKQYFNTSDEVVLKSSIDNALKDKSFTDYSDASKADELFGNIIYSAKQAESFVKRKKRIWFAAAAVIAVIVSVGSLYYSTIGTSKDNITTLTPEKDILPGSNKAVLTLANGAKVVLNNAGNGVVAKEGSVNLIKQGGELSYLSLSKPTTSVSYNTVSTPNGGMYELVLSDGTKVWLDAASSLKYPTSFVGSERKVELTGEAYFEVVHNAKMPFRVVVNKVTVEDIGTHFNINAYPEESAIKTTLVEGAVKVSSGNVAELLAPGKMASFHKSAFTLTDADIEQELAWKNGYFIFNKTGVEAMMRQLSRWYDVTVSYNGKVPDNVFVGQIKREETLVGALKILELSGMHFRIEGRQLIVLE